MEMSAYQSFKLLLLSFLPLGKDAVHIYIGMIVLLVWVIGFHRPLGSWKSLLPVLVVAGIMELIDLYDDIQWLGHPRWGNSLHDVFNTTFWPAVLVATAHFGLLCRAVPPTEKQPDEKDT